MKTAFSLLAVIVMLVVAGTTMLVAVTTIMGGVALWTPLTGWCVAMTVAMAVAGFVQWYFNFLERKSQ